MKERKRNRLQGYNYSQDNLYFITSCVHDRVCCFGEIVPVRTGRDLSVLQKMILNQYGKIANDQWYWLAEQYPYVVLYEFVVMPNHIHGILEINRENISMRDGNADNVGTGRDLSLHDLSLHDLSLHNLSLPSDSEIKIKSLSELIGAYKTTTSKKIHQAGFIEFAWQRSFHDHIIRNEESYMRIADYILNNPSTWADDKFYKK